MKFNKQVQVFYRVCSLALLAGVLLAGCGGKENAQSGGISAEVIWPNTSQAGSATQTMLAPGKTGNAVAAAGVVNMRFVVTGADMATVESIFPAADGTGTIGSIPAGADRTLTIEALDSGDSVLYEGNATGITVVADTDSSATVQMAPAAGSTAPPWPPQAKHGKTHSPGRLFPGPLPTISTGVQPPA